MAESDIKLPYKLPSSNDWQPHAKFYHPMYAGSIDGTDLYPHDRAVVRAMLSRYQPNKNVSGDQSKTLFVSRLSKDTNQETVHSIFEKYGELERCKLIRDFVTGFSRGYAFVEFKRKKDALNAARETHQMNLDGKQILVDFECERNLDGWKPRRFGGGFGGRKESGQLRFGGIDRPFRRPLPDKVNHFTRGKQHGDNFSIRESRGDQGKLFSRGNGRNRDEYDKDCKARDHGRDHRNYNSNDRDKSRHYEEHSRDSRGHSKDHKHRDYKDKRDYRRYDQRDKNDHYRDKDDHYRDREDRHRDREDRHRDRKDRHRDRDDHYRDRARKERDTKGEVRSGSSNSSRDPE